MPVPTSVPVIMVMGLVSASYDVDIVQKHSVGEVSIC